MTIKAQRNYLYEGFLKIEGVEHNCKMYEVVRHPGSVAVVAYDDRYVYLTKQFRPAIGDDVIELVAGTMEPGMDAHDIAVKELAEEVGKGARSWRYGTTFNSSPGYTDEGVILFFATDLYDFELPPDEDENIEVVKASLDNLDSMIRLSYNAKTKIGLMMLKERLP